MAPFWMATARLHRRTRGQLGHGRLRLLQMGDAGAHDRRAIGVGRECRILLPRIQDLRDAAVLDLECGVAIRAVVEREPADQRHRPGVGTGRGRVVSQDVRRAERAVLVRRAEARLQIHLAHPDQPCFRLVSDVGVFNRAGGQQKRREAEQTKKGHTPPAPTSDALQW